MAEDAAATTVDPAPLPERVSFFTLNPRKIGRSRLIRALAIGLCIVSFSALPIWRLLWYFPVYGYADFLPYRDSSGHLRAAWHWIDGKEIRIYAAPGVDKRDADTIAEGVRSMVEEIHLDFTVNVQPMPPEIEKAYRNSLITKQRHGQEVTQISYHRLAAQLITLRKGDPHADMIVVEPEITECSWAFGMASFTCGLAVLRQQHVSFHLGKHESCHLIGYHYHDTLPLYVFGYREHETR